jgi:hypothetical protein
MKTRERAGPIVAEHQHWRRSFERPHDQDRSVRMMDEPAFRIAVGET